jgi:ABC-type multidrug transport system permease subunit
VTENTLCLYYKDQLFRKITEVDSGNYMKIFESNLSSFAVLMGLSNKYLQP